MEALLASHFRHHGPLLPNGSRTEYTQWFQDTRSAFPDLRATIENLVVEGDRAAGRWTFQGTNQGTLATPSGPVPPTGKRVTVSGMTLFRFENGKVAEDWHSGDDLGFMQQLGLIPMPEQASTS